MTAETLLRIVLLAANANTKQEQARVAWRFSDLLWHGVLHGECDMRLARAFNNLCQDAEWDWVNDLWSADERRTLWPNVPVPKATP